MQKKTSRFFRGVTTVLLVASSIFAAGNLSGEESSFGFIPIVMPFYTPDTSGGLGFYLMLYEKSAADRLRKKPDEFALYGTWSLKNQASLGSTFTAYLRDFPLMLSCDAEWSFMPSTFWGIGPDTPDSTEETYTAPSLALRPSLLFRLSDRASIGPIIDWRRVSVDDTKHGGILESSPVAGADGTVISGGGFRFILDMRDNPFYPREGFYLDVQDLSYRKSTGGDDDFNVLKFDGRWFIGISGDHVLAFHALFTLGTGSVPFEAMEGIGGNSMMRGLLQDRFLDKCRLAGQAEYRFPLPWRLAGTIFTGAGTVAPSPDEFTRRNIKITGGAGLRFLADREEHISLRLDLGFDDDGRAQAYFMVKEAF